METAGKEENLDFDNIFKLNIPLIDEQHAEFFRLIDESFHKIRKEECIAFQSCLDLIKDLEDYLNHHFHDEEELMKEAKYPDIDKHILQHRYFINKIQEYKLELSFDSPYLLKKLIEFMKKWFLFHIIQTDSQYKDDVKKIIHTI